MDVEWMERNFKNKILTAARLVVSFNKYNRMFLMGNNENISLQRRNRN